jgi:hypothetical protein
MVVRRVTRMLNVAETRRSVDVPGCAAALERARCADIVDAAAQA